MPMLMLPPVLPPSFDPPLLLPEEDPLLLPEEDPLLPISVFPEPPLLKKEPDTPILSGRGMNPGG